MIKALHSYKGYLAIFLFLLCLEYLTEYMDGVGFGYLLGIDFFMPGQSALKMFVNYVKMYFLIFVYFVYFDTSVLWQYLDMDSWRH